MKRSKYPKHDTYRVLNIGSGKWPLERLQQKENIFKLPADIRQFDTVEFVNVDTSYKVDPSESDHYEEYDFITNKYRNKPIEEYIEKSYHPFDQIVAIRYMEHVPYDRMFEFVYNVSTVCKEGAVFTILVPDHEVLAKKLLEMSQMEINQKWLSLNLLVTYEILADPGFPHTSIWTEKHAYYYLETEGLFKIINIDKNIKFEGRSVYMLIKAIRV